MARLFTFPLLLCLVSFPAAADAWDDVLTSAGLSRSTARMNPLDFEVVGAGEYRLPLFNVLLGEPLSAPFHARVLRSSLLASAGNAGDLTIAAATRMGAGTRLNLLGNPMASYAEQSAKPNSLRDAIIAVWAAADREPSAQERRRLEVEVRKVPRDVAQQAALILWVSATAIRHHAAGLAPVRAAGLDLPQQFRMLSGQEPWLDDNQPRYETLLRTIDMPRLMVGGELLAMASDRAAVALAARTGSESFLFRAWTPFGWITLRGAGNDAQTAVQPHLLLLDTGGDDRYASGGATYSEKYPVSVLIDAGGNDRYINAPELADTPVMQSPLRKTFAGPPSFGAGILGYGILIDAAGDDLYRSVGPTQGRGWAGLGLLQDRAGNDTYEGYRNAQGAGDLGVGILHDMGGTDRYLCLQTSQGYGGTRGVGLLLDQGDGADTYIADDTVLDDPSPQSKLHNVSLAQGCGYGRRADISDGHSLAGGIGILLDEGGDNRLKAGVFAQGVGYWMGAGLCLLGPGNDTSDGVWYVQGASAHFAVGVMDDTGGNDTRRAAINMALGAGHDFSVGWLIDGAGDDVNEGPNLSMGAGNASGFGFFWDRAGSDTYRAKPGITLGGAGGGSINSVRERNTTLGVFMDSGGTDTYPAAIPGPKDNATWGARRGERGKAADERGTGLDTEAPNLAEPA